MEKFEFAAQIEDAFIGELHDKGNTWRLLRNDTFIDLINAHFQPDQAYTDETLVDIVNLGFKFKLTNALGIIEVPSLLILARIPFDRNISDLEEHYRLMLNEAVNQSTRFKGKGFDDLNREFINLRMISKLDINTYTVDYLDTIIGICLNILNPSN
jgi:hypothetical protein